MFKRTLLTLSYFFIFSQFTLQASAEGWPFWGYNLQNDHHPVAETKLDPQNVHRLKPQWIFRSQHNIAAFPTLAGDYLYITDFWVTKPSVLFHPIKQSGNVYAINKNSGEKIWSRKITALNHSLVNNFSRSSPAIFKDLIIIGDSVAPFNLVLGPKKSDARVMALNRFTGELLWQTVVEPFFAAQITQSPVVYNGVVYVGVSSMEEELPKALGRLYHCCKFRGSMVALDARTGKILWKTYTVPDHLGRSTEYSGAAIWGSAPAIDPKRNLLYVGTGNNYDVPSAIKRCMKERTENKLSEKECVERFGDPDNYANSIIAFDLTSGEVKWSKKTLLYDAWNVACTRFILPWYPNFGGCPYPAGIDGDFGQAPMILTINQSGKSKDILAIGQKSGLFFALDPDKEGEIIWTTRVGPDGVFGGHQWGSAADEKRIYTQTTNFDHKKAMLIAGPYKGVEVNGGYWSALDKVTGEILWQTPVPASFLPLRGEGISHITFGKNLGMGFFGVSMGPLTVANGVVYAGSMDGHMYALDAENGAILWSFKTKGSVMSAPSIVDGVLYWGTGYEKLGFDGNELYAFSIDGGVSPQKD
ncbi:MAG: PQQ-binding-like beta-propeller repeat protein [Oligoflexia bacterium]|nr:PQQ-binding-like beta-propeller repeat protein [Oligoflexia bacterium]MBF0367058.1 PQQ-binding-like beta-propeller repeat protein [Oligoflexia bacterium]